MSPKVANLLIVLAAAAVVCGAVIGFDSRLARDATANRELDKDAAAVDVSADSLGDGRASSPASNAGAVQTTERTGETRKSGDQSPHSKATDYEVGPQSAFEGEVENFPDWLSRYLETQPDLKLLRRELEDALARLPADETETEVAVEIAAIEALRRDELKNGSDYRSLMDSAEQFIERYPRSALAEEAKTLFEKYARAWDVYEFQAARDFAKTNPQSFDAQLARFQTYIDHHGAAGRFAAEVQAAIHTIRAEWAEHDYRQIYDFATRYPSDLSAVATRARRYLDEHPTGRHRVAAERFLARYEQAATPREYRLRVKSGSFARSIGRALSNGPDMAVEIEVAGVRVGRTPIVADSFEPVWNYEFPQNVRWRLGDPVRIRVVDFDYSNRTVLKIEPPADDPLAMRYLSGTITAEGHQLVFESDFQVPTLPAP